MRFVFLHFFHTMVSYIQLSWWSELITKNQDLTLALLTCSLIALAIWLLHKSRKTTLSLPPGPRGLPVVGYLPFLGHNLHIEFTKMAQSYGPIFKLKLGSKSHIVISSSDLAKVVVREQDEIFANRDRPMVAMVLTNGQNIAWSDNNSYWRNLRKLFVTEIMNKKNLEASHSFRRTEVRKTIKHIYETMGTMVDVGNLSFLTSLSVVTSLLWGKSLGDDEKSRKLGIEIRDVILNMTELLARANVSDFFPVLAKLDLQGVQRQAKLQSKKMNEILDGIIDERIAIKPREDQVGRKDFLQILLELKQENKFNMTQIKTLLLDILAGATDTTTTMVEWVMAELLENPKVMQNVKGELNEVVGLNSIVEEFHLPKLEYIDAVVKETFRLHPPVPLLITRCPIESCTAGGYTVPKGSNVHLNVWAIHRDPQYWEDPLEFNPNRFLSSAGDGDAGSKFDYTGYNTMYMPFGSGRRRCPGVLLGEKMLMYILASMLHSFDWSLPDGKENNLTGKFGIMLKRVEPLVAIPSQRLPDKTLYM